MNDNRNSTIDCLFTFLFEEQPSSIIWLEWILLLGPQVCLATAEEKRDVSNNGVY